MAGAIEGGCARSVTLMRKVHMAVVLLTIECKRAGVRRDGAFPKKTLWVDDMASVILCCNLDRDVRNSGLWARFPSWSVESWLALLVLQTQSSGDR